MKLAGKPNVGNPHVGFDEAGAGNGLSGTAPALDPTDEAGTGNGPMGHRAIPRPYLRGLGAGNSPRLPGV
jgi:hypothetical protein